MSYSAKTVFVFGSYLFPLGLILLLAPNSLLILFQMPTISEVWIHIVGMLVLFIAIYYIVAAREKLMPIIIWSVYLRVLVFLFLCAFVLANLANVTLILFGAIRKETSEASGARSL